MYVLSGVRDERTKVDRLADYEHLKAKVLLPAVGYANWWTQACCSPPSQERASTASGSATTCCCAAWCEP